MKILDDLLATLDVDANVKDVRQGFFHTAVVTRYCGLAATLPKDVLRQEKPAIREPGFLTHKSALELARMSYSTNILEASVGMATINSLIELDEGNCLNLNARDLIVQRATGKSVVIIGHFPFVPRLRETAERVWVIEKNPQYGDFSENEAEKLIPQADIVGITGTAFTNHTIEHILSLCAAEAFVVVLGDTTPMSPILFDYSIDALSGTRVIDTNMVLRCVSEAATYRQIQGIKQFTMTRDSFAANKR